VPGILRTFLITRVSTYKVELDEDYDIEDAQRDIDHGMLEPPDTEDIQVEEIKK
jgi:hypothetical protein